MKVLRFSAKNWNKFGQYQERQTNSSIPSWQLDSTPGWFCKENKADNTQTFDFSKKYKASRFNIAKIYDENVFIYNTASEAIAVVSEYEYTMILNPNNLNSLNSDSKQLVVNLFDLGFIVEVDDDESQKFEYIINRSKYNNENIKSFVIYPTTQCNARCFYCFAQKEVETNLKMSDSTIKDVCRFICDNIEPGNDIVYRWFGGEPLMAKDVIHKIVEGVNNQMGDSIKYHSIITTNASLFTPKLLEEAIEHWHLKKILVPLDGYKNEHDKRKNLKEKLHIKGEYDFIISFMKDALEKGVHIVCRLNLDKINISDLDKILNDLVCFIKYDNFYLQITTLHAPEFSKSNVAKVYFSKEDFPQIYSQFFLKLLELGFYSDISSFFPRRQLSVCEAKLNNHFLISADGSLYACEQQNQIKANCVGSCKTGVIHNSALRSWYDEKLEQECCECKFLPICLGGCSHYRRRNDNLVSPCTRFKYYSDSIMDIIMAHNGKFKQYEL